MSDDQVGPSAYAVPMTALEHDAHPPQELLREETGEAPPESPMRPHQLNWIKATGVVGDGRW